MQLTALDWWIVGISIVVSFIPALVLARRAGASASEFFTSGRAAPWWLIGVSMVATTFSTDTPNLVTDLVRTNGVANNWAWWSFLLTGMATVFFYARLWRRSGVMTDLEFYEVRYSGKAATAVRAFRAVYLGLFFNCVIMATVNLAAAKIANVLLGWPMERTLLVCAGINVAFAATSGLWGVLVTDFIQFGIAMAGSVAAAVYALRQPQVGGLAGLLEKLPPKTLALVPDFGDWQLTLTVLIIPLTVQWWSVWYPGAEPGGGSYIAQRMLAAKSERDALSGTLFFNVAHYALRSWPWILVALASILVFPTLDDIARALPHVDRSLIGNDMAYPAMLLFLPPGMLGLMVAGLLAAYVSTISTHLNWGTSYLVHDVYRRFVKPAADERHYVAVGRLMTAVLMVIASGLTFVLETAGKSFQLLLAIGAGTGLLYLLRWFWWRVSAWCEIAAMGTSFVLAAVFFGLDKAGRPLDGTTTLLLSVAITTVVWVLVAYVGPQTDRTVLERFYALVRPAGPGWRAIRERAGLPASPDSMAQQLLGWVLGVGFVYAALFGSGSALQGHTQIALVWGVVFVVTGIGLVRLLPSLWAGAADG
ncbi:MAG: Na+:solute symporter [Gemmatimonadaceae bacterium]|nr:Na+:solute symporter [Gemmatimonadaceae bacterium]